MAYNRWLSHHGVLGMHWGEQNGPPYPLDSSVSNGHRLLKGAGGKRPTGGSVQTKKKTNGSVHKSSLGKTNKEPTNGRMHGKLTDLFTKKKQTPAEKSATRIESKIQDDINRGLRPERKVSNNSNTEGFEEHNSNGTTYYTKQRKTKREGGWSYNETVGEHPSTATKTMSEFHKKSGRAINRVFKNVKKEYEMWKGESVSDDEFKKIAGEPNVFYFGDDSGTVEIGFWVNGGEMSMYYYPSDDSLDHEVMFND